MAFAGFRRDGTGTGYPAGADSLGAAGQDAAAKQLKNLITKYDVEGAMDKLNEIALALGIVQ